MIDCKFVPTPLPVKILGNTATNQSDDNPQIFRIIVSSLQYLTLTSLDISFLVNKLSQQMHSPKVHHFTLLKWLMRYIKGTMHHGIFISSSSLNLSAFIDADWAGDSLDRHSTTSFCVFLGDNLISWKVSKKKSVFHSSIEVEFHVLVAATTDIIWLHHLLQEFDISVFTATTLYYDNLFAISLAKNPIFHAKTKHVESDFHFVHD